VPFPGRPDIRFDSAVVLTMKPGRPTSATVNDLANHTSMTLSATSFVAESHVVAVVVPGTDRPSTGLKPSEFWFNFWPEDGSPGSSHIASFALEFDDPQVDVIRPDRDGGDHGPRGDDRILGVLIDGDDGPDHRDGGGRGHNGHR
jgi:hypothetical protein